MSSARAADIEVGEDGHGAAAVVFDGVSKTYRGAKAPAVNDLSLEVAAGEICVLVGPSVRDRDPAKLRREIGYVIRQIGLFPHRTIGENIATVPRLLGWPEERRRARVEELMQLISLDPEIADRYPAQLSGGQQQRVGVARALAADPPVMLMDEPFGAIDPIARERLQNEFLRLQAEIRKTILFVTHDIDEARRSRPPFGSSNRPICRKERTWAQYLRIVAAPPPSSSC